MFTHKPETEPAQRLRTLQGFSLNSVSIAEHPANIRSAETGTEKVLETLNIRGGFRPGDGFRKFRKLLGCMSGPY